MPPADRRAFPAERQAAISPSHAAFVARLAGLVRQGGAVLDAACGTGKYWPALLAAGLQVTGVDQSAGMLAQARRKYPQVPSRVLALQDLAELPDRFDGLLCVDALENVAPEDWPVVAAGLAAVLKDQAPAYVTVELPDGPLRPTAPATTTTRPATRCAAGWPPPGSPSPTRPTPITTGTCCWPEPRTVRSKSLFLPNGAWSHPPGPA